MSVKINKSPFEQIRKGINYLADTVALTLGPNGKNILIDMGKNNPPLSTRDGVTVAHYINLEDTLENFGAMLVKQAARNTNQEAGDGTTTATVLARAIFEEGVKYILAGESPIKVKRSLDEALAKVIDAIKINSMDVKDKLEDVATISANNDRFLGKIIASAINKVGKHGTVLVEGSPKKETLVKFQDGMIIERGWNETSPYFVTDMQKMEAVYENPAIMIIDDKIHSFEQLDNVLRWVAKEKKALILSVREIEDTVLAWLVANKLQKGLRIAVIKTPGFNSAELIEDFANRVGARPFNPDWNSINNFEPSNLGGAKRVIVGRIDTTIIEGCGDISGRLVELNAQAEAESDTTKQSFIRDRINRLQGSVATICLHADSETEMKDLKLRIEDAINASRAALSEGVLAGSGVALLSVIPSGDSIGEKILAKAFEQPFRNIILNADENPDMYIMEAKNSKGTMGFDGYSKQMVNLWDAGILDPTKVTRTALTKAGSVASMLLITGHAIVVNEEKK